MIINTDEWQKQAQAAREMNYNRSYIAELIREGRIASLKVPEWGLSLVAKPVKIEKKGTFGTSENV